jgi:chromosome segregation ATPase
MKLRDQRVVNDGFETNVAEKMPRIRKAEEGIPPEPFSPPPPLSAEPSEANLVETAAEAKAPEKKILFSTSQERAEQEQEPAVDVLRIIEDLHAQLLVSSQSKRALEVDLLFSRKTIHQHVQDNKDLRHESEELRKEIQKLRELQAEGAYLKEENIDALERIKELQHELRMLGETLARVTQERDGAAQRCHQLESQLGQTEILRIRGKLKERESSQLADENRELRTRLEEALTQNIDLERKYEEMRKSFQEVKESLTFLRDTCKKNYYNLSEPVE